MRAAVLAASMAVAILCAHPPSAFAQPAATPPQESSTRDRARALADEGMRLLDGDDAAAALARFREADGLFHAPTITLMIARCQERVGALADAAGTYEALSKETLAAGSPKEFVEAQAAARAELAALAPRVPMIEAVPQAGESADGWALRIDRRELPVPPSGLRAPVNPGTYDIALIVRGSVAVQRTVVLGERSLERLTLPAAEHPAGGMTALRGGSIASFSVAAIGLAMGIGAGVVALDKQSELEEHCPTRACDPADEDLRDAALLNASLSTVGFVVAGAGAGVGLILLVVDLESSDTGSAGLQVSPTGLSFRARF